MTTISAVPPTVHNLPLDLLDASPKNPRRTMDDKGLEELAASIRQSGISQPLLVRPDTWTEGLIEGRYEIVCGHRRSEAATIAGLEEVPCIVRSMTDQEAAEIALVDNLQRVDVPALEEAEAFGALLDLHGSVEAVAARVGKDVAHVAKRLKLRALGQHQRTALYYFLITVDHALLLARLGVEEQDAALKWCLDRNAGSKMPVEKVIEASKKYLKDDGRFRQWEPETVVRLREHIEQSSGRKLSRAPWSLDDAELCPERGACSMCPSNTKANRALFEDLDIEEATCADGACFEWKRDAFVQLQIVRVNSGHAKAAPGAGPAAVRLSWKTTSVKPAWAKDGTGPNLARTFKAGQWVEAKPKSCEHVRPGVTVDWDDPDGYMHRNKKPRKPGETLLVCVAGGCKAHGKEWEKEKRESTNMARNENSAIARAEREQWESKVKGENAARAELVKAAIAKIDNIAGPLLRRIVLRALPDWIGPEDEEHFPGLKKGLKAMRVESPEFARAAACTLFVGDDSEEYWCNENFPGAIEDGRKDLIAVLKDLGYDASKAWVAPKPPAKPKADKPSPKKAAKPATKKAAKKAIKKAAKK